MKRGHKLGARSAANRARIAAGVRAAWERRRSGAPVARTSHELPAKRVNNLSHAHQQGGVRYMDMTDQEVAAQLGREVEISEITDDNEVIETGLKVYVPEEEKWDDD